MRQWVLTTGDNKLDGKSGTDLLVGIGPIDGTGNTRNNMINGNDNNTLFGGAGGIDILFGHKGADTYLASPGELVVESFGEGTDTVRVNFTYILPDNVENLTIGSTNSVNGTGNDRLEGKVGADVLIGGEGDDTFIYSASNHGGDTIPDFSQSGTNGNDLIDVSVLLSGDGVKEDFAFGGTTATANGIWYKETSSATIVTTTLYFDTNGDTRSVEMVLNLTGLGLGLSATDFIL